MGRQYDVVSYCGGTLGSSEQLAESMAEEQGADWATLDENERAQTRIASRERYLATAVLLGADKSRYKGLICETENSYLNGLDNYPRTITAAYNLLVSWKGDPGRQPRQVASNGVAFTNDGVALVNPGRPKRDMSTIDCHNCGEYGHYATDCPKPKKQGQTGKQLLTAGMESGEFDKEFTYNDKWDSFAFVTDGEPNTEPDSNSNAKADVFTTDDKSIDDKWTMCDDDRINFVFANNGAPQPRSVGAAFTVDKESRIPRSWICLITNPP
jgi:hypothetical protein